MSCITEMDVDALLLGVGKERKVLLDGVLHGCHSILTQDGIASIDWGHQWEATRNLG